MMPFPEFNKKHCPKCGQPTIAACEHCKAQINGHLFDSMSLHYDLPSFCHECGNPYPWTSRSIAAATEYADLIGELSDAEKSELKKDIDELVKEGPRTVIAASRFRKSMKKMGSVAA